MDNIILDYNFSAKANIDCGISSEDLEKQFSKANKGFSILMDMVKEGSVGFPDLVNQDLTEIKNLAKECHRKYNDLIVIGIGGSALGLEAVINAIIPHGYCGMSFADRKGYPRCWILDNTDPSLTSSVLRSCKQEDTFVVVISKSGSTVETAANFALVCDWLKSVTEDLKKHVAVITDPEKGPLRDFALENNVNIIPLPSNIGGRFSVLSAVGLLPASILGVDIDKMLKGAASIVNSDWKKFLTMAAIYMHFIDLKKSINVLMPYSSRLVKFAEWFSQLWGESLGKRYDNEGKEIYFGTTPLRTYGAVDQHSQLQLFREGPDDKHTTFIGLESHDGEQVIEGEIHKIFSYLKDHKLGELLNAELNATETALLKVGRPSMRLNVKCLDEYSLGQLFMIFQYVVAIIGLANNINPFDQPGVEEGKDFVYGLMGREGYSKKKEEFDQLYVKRPEYFI